MSATVVRPPSRHPTEFGRAQPKYPGAPERPIREVAGARIVLVAVLLASVALGLAPLFAPPAVVPASAPAGEFSAERALDHLVAIASVPHPMGSPEHAEAVAYLVDQLRSLGLDPQVQVSSATAPPEDFSAGSVPAGRVQNVLARLPGSDSTGTLLLIGNYDSMPTTPGAGDPASSGAVVLETLRALRASGTPLRNDLVVAFMDVDPNGLIGDQAFVAEHPWARDVTLAFSFSSSGIGGPVMLETTTPAGVRFLGDMLAVSPHPLAYSSLTGVMRLMGGGGPMLWAARGTGAAGAEFVAIDGPQTYHTMANSVERLDQRTLQHHGSYALALARHFGNTPLDRPQGPDLVFFNVAPDRLVAYPAAWAVPLAVVVGLLSIGAIAIGLRRGHLTWRGLLVGVLAFPLATLAAVLVGAAAWWAIKTLDPDHQVFLIGVAYNADVYHAGMVLLAIAAMAGVYALLARWCRPLNLATGVLPWLAGLTILLAVAAPGLSYLLTWPLLASVLALGWALLRPTAAGRPWPQAIAVAFIGVPTLVLVAPFVHVLFGLLIRMDTFLPIPVGSGTILVVALAVGLLLPALRFLGGSRPWLVPATTAIAGLLVIGSASAFSTFDARQPRPTSIAYVFDADTRVAAWVSADSRIDGWTQQFLPTAAEPTEFLAMPNSNPDRSWPAWQTAAPTVEIAAPDVSVLGDVVSGGQRTLRLRATSPRGAPNLYLDVQAPGDVVAASLDGKPLDLGAWPSEQRSRFRLAYHAIPPGGVDLELAFPDAGPVSIRVEDRSNGLPAIPGQAFFPRPPDTMPAPFEMADPTIVMRTVRVGHSARGNEG